MLLIALSERTIRIDNGRLVLSGSVAKIKASYTRYLLYTYKIDEPGFVKRLRVDISRAATDDKQLQPGTVGSYVLYDYALVSGIVAFPVDYSRDFFSLLCSVSSPWSGTRVLLFGRTQGTRVSASMHRAAMDISSTTWCSL